MAGVYIKRYAVSVGTGWRSEVTFTQRKVYVSRTFRKPKVITHAVWKRLISELTVKLTFITRSNFPCLHIVVAPISNIPTRLNYGCYCAHSPRLCTQFTECCEDTKLSRFCTDNKTVSSSIITYNEVTCFYDITRMA